MITEVKLMRNALDAIDKALTHDDGPICPNCGSEECFTEPYKQERYFCDDCKEIFDWPRCPKCHGPMNLVRDAHVTRTDGCRKSDLYLCDNPRCNGFEVVEP